MGQTSILSSTQEYKKKGREREYMREYQRKRRANGLTDDDRVSNAKKLQRRDANKQRAVTMLGGKCAICGGEFPLCVYDFHHVNPDEKELEPASIMHKSFDEINDELMKCVVLCSNCHRQVHAGLVEIPTA